MYCTVEDVRNALTPGAVYTDPSTAAQLQNGQIEDAIRQADSRINGYLPAGYVAPTVTLENADVVGVPPFRYWSRDIAAYLATLTYRRSKDLSQDDPVRLRYTDTMLELQLVAKGVFELPPSTAPGGPLDGDVFVYNQYQGQLFGPEDFALAPSSGGMTQYQRAIHDMGP